MLKNLTAANIYIVCGHTDMRKSIDGLAAIVSQQFKLNLFSDSLFLFCGRRRDRLKALLWEGDGFIMLYKRLENGRFNWPRNEQEVRNLTQEQFAKLSVFHFVLCFLREDLIKRNRGYFVGFVLQLLISCYCYLFCPFDCCAGKFIDIFLIIFQCCQRDAHNNKLLQIDPENYTVIFYLCKV